MSKVPFPNLKIVPMALAESQNFGQNLSINYSFGNCQFGLFLVASSHVGICHLSFGENKEALLLELQKTWHKAKLTEFLDDFQLQAQHILNSKPALDSNFSQSNTLSIHLKGTDFQLLVWQKLLQIPFGQTQNYKQISQQIGSPLAFRAVGTAIGKNSVAYLIPCHRVLASNAGLGGFRWGLELKRKMLDWEKI